MIGEARIITVKAVRADEPDEEDWESAERIPVLVMEITETAQPKFSDHPRPKQTLTWPPLGLQHQIEYEAWMRKEPNERGSNTGGASIKF